MMNMLPLDVSFHILAYEEGTHLGDSQEMLVDTDTLPLSEEDSDCHCFEEW
jgi:hypothetical protein